jgi:hypothetical protein
MATYKESNKSLLLNTFISNSDDDGISTELADDFSSAQCVIYEKKDLLLIYIACYRWTWKTYL